MDKGWVCCYCTLENAIRRFRCAACNAERPKPGLIKLYAAQASISWTCVKCGQANSGHRVQCIKCFAIGSWESKDINGHASTGWTCCYCTSHNATRRSSCGGCYAEKPPPNLIKLYAAQSFIGWTCLKCNQENSGHCVRCIKCLATGSWMSHGTNSDFSTGPSKNTRAPVRQPSDIDTKTKARSSRDSVHNASDIKAATSDSTDELRIVLLGRTGEGKSATGNTILGKEEFTSSLNSMSVTKTCQRGTGDIHGRCIEVIDTPGMYDTDMSIPDITTEVVRPRFLDTNSNSNSNSISVFIFLLN